MKVTTILMIALVGTIVMLVIIRTLSSLGFINACTTSMFVKLFDTQKDWTQIGCKRSDGFGAQYHGKMAAFAISRQEKKHYVHIPFDDVGHNVSSKELSNLELMTGMSTDETDTPRKIKLDSLAATKIPSSYYTAGVRKELRNMYFKSDKPTPIVCDVAFHVRRGDAQHWWHNIFTNRLTKNHHIYNIITKYFSNKKVCIFSEGGVSDFGTIAKLKNVTFALNVDLCTTFHSLVVAPHLVIANSTLSFTAGVLNANRVYYHGHFWHPPLKDWTKLF